MTTQSASQRAIEALTSGSGDIHKDVYGESNPHETNEVDVDVDELEADESPDILDMLNEGTGEETQEEPSTETEEQDPDSSILDALDESKATVKQEAVAPDFEIIKAADKQIKIDFNDRKRIKQAFAAEAGMRKFQRERDEARKQVEQAEPLRKKAEDYDKLDELYQTKGVAGVVEQLTGGKSLDDLVQERIDRLILQQEDPNKAAQLDYEEKLAEERRQRELLERRMTEVTEQTRAERDSIEEAKLEGMIKPVFAQYSFAGKFGDPDAEHQMDEALWNQAFARLETYPDDVEITPALIRKEFRTVATNFGKIIKTQVKSKTAEAARTKRVAAKENVQTAVAAGTAGNNSKADFAKKFKSGDITGALMDVLNNKVRL